MMRFARTAAALALVAISAAAAEVPFIEDNYGQAIARGRDKDRPVFIETWAPWCHTCRSMQAYVYTDKKLVDGYGDRFVWLSINREDAKNADFLARYNVEALPTLFVVDPKNETVLLRYVGGATSGQLTKLLDQVLARSKTEADTILALADRLGTEGKFDDAAQHYASALSRSTKGWPAYPRTAESYVLALSMGGQNDRCAAEALRLHRRVPATSAATIAATGLSCAAGLDEKNPLRGERIVMLERHARAALTNPKLDISDDDRSGIYIALIEGRQASKDEAAARRLTEEWSAFLDRAAAGAKSARQRAVYDSHRLSAYIELGTPEKAIPMLEQSARDFPDDYNPHSRLSLAYRSMKKYGEALAASDQALRLAYGPRKLGILTTRAGILVDKGDKEGARKTLSDAIAYAQSLPQVHQRASTIAALEKRIMELTP
jgi:thioredoxin-like negative regulator of GroEL